MGLFKKKKKDAAPAAEQSKEKGVFQGFALLSEPKWSKTQFVAEKNHFVSYFFFERKFQKAAQGA